MTSEKLDYDVVIIGAGISGICFAYRLQERHPDLTYCILESRKEIGGTWSFFKYPGLRSDSDLYTFGFPWRPWTETEPIAQGAAIVNYMKRTVAADGIDKHIKFEHRVSNLSWSSSSKTWTTRVNADGRESTIRSRLAIMATGYYDYEQGLHAHIPGIKDFSGEVVHPQFWPEDLSYKDKNVVIIGSGATAITLLPAMAKEAKHVTMLQRSPSYILSVPVHNKLENVIRAICPKTLASKIIRMKWIVWPTMFRTWCLWFPNAAKRHMRKATLAQVPPELVDSDFKPSYNPFEQRMCMCPDGDFYQCLREGKGSIKTGLIDTVTDKDIKLKSGEELHPDVIITATGLKLRLGGGIKVDVDGEDFQINEHYVWKGLMFDTLPNFFFSFGYFDNAWTLGVDTSAQLACRLIKQMQRDRVDVIIPTRSEEEKQTMKDKRFMPLTSTYVEKALSVLPKLGDRPQWCGRSTYLVEMFTVKFGDIRTGLRCVRS
ncbi:putative FAD/NAD(P)-binding domain superfamily [Septoria linicola]|nr:putative FAD/NAD(P)-binding domain superfamily [Septoria linicola]